jgi:aminoglycoside phosphotransferase (APT) family kinase protein
LAKDSPHFTKALRKIEFLVRRCLDEEFRFRSVTRIGNAWESVLALPIWSGPPAWIHGDVAPTNILLVDGRLSTVIAFGVIGIGDPTQTTSLLLPYYFRPNPSLAANFRHLLSEVLCDHVYLGSP